MKHNLKFSLLFYAVICLIIIYTGGLYATDFSEVLFTVIAVALFYFAGHLFRVQDSSVKNLLSVVLPSAICLVFTVVASQIYQYYVVELYHYTQVPTLYKIFWGIAYYVNAPIIPISELARYISPTFNLPYGLIYTFFVPMLVMWLGLERKAQKHRKTGKPETDLFADQDK